MHSPFEHIGRGEVIREVLSADSRFEMMSPSEWGIDVINAVHNPGLHRFFTTAWQEYQDIIGPTREVTPEVFYRPSLRHKMADGVEPVSITGRLGWWCLKPQHLLLRNVCRSAWGSGHRYDSNAISA